MKQVGYNKDLIQFFIKIFVCSHSYCRYTAFKETPTYIKCFTVASMTKMQFKQNVLEKLDYTGIAESHRNESFSRLKKGFFFVQLSRGWVLAAGSKCSPCQQLNFISLFLYLGLIFA